MTDLIKKIQRSFCVCALIFLASPASAQTALGTPVINAVTDADIKANLKTIAATQARLTALLKLGTPQSLASPQAGNAANYQKDYIWAKAQRWLDVAQDEVRNNNRSAFPQAALAQSQALITLLEAADTHGGQGLQAGWDTPHPTGANKIRDDIWTPLLLWKQLALEGAPVAQAGARCALATSGYTEVQLVWAAWIGSHYGWRSALPYISHAERSFDQAQVQFVTCRDAAALKAEPAKVLASEAPLVIAAAPVSTATPLMAAPLNSPASTPKASAVNLPENSIVFAHNSRNLDAATRRAIQAVFAQWQSAGSFQAIALQGSVDDSGRGQGNTALLRARAKTVANALQKLGVPAELLSVLAPRSSPKALKNQAPNPAKRTVFVTLTP